MERKIQDDAFINNKVQKQIQELAECILKLQADRRELTAKVDRLISKVNRIEGVSHD